MRKLPQSSVPSLVSLFGALCLAGCTGNSQSNAMAEANKALHQRYVAELNKGNEAFVDEYLDPAAVYHGPMGDLNKAQFIELHNSMLRAFPDMHMTIEDQVAEGDEVVTRWEAHGTHQGTFQGIAPTGKQVRVTGIIITRVVNGKDVESWEELNLLGLMQQLGAIPAPGGSSGR